MYFQKHSHISDNSNASNNTKTIDNNTTLYIKKRQPQRATVNVFTTELSLL